MNTREKFLHRPKGKLVIERLKPLTKSAVKEMERAFGTNLTQAQRSELLWTETVHSAAIEDEDRPEQIHLHQRALAEFLAKPLTPKSLPGNAPQNDGWAKARESRSIPEHRDYHRRIPPPDVGASSVPDG